MKILFETEIKGVEKATMELENISSWQLMERAAECLTSEIIKISNSKNIFIIVGNSGNGGDGLAIARMVSKAGYKVNILTLFSYEDCSEEYKVNYKLLPKEVAIFDNIEQFSNQFSDDGVVIDAIFGTGYKVRPHKPHILRAILLINGVCRKKFKVISIDTPSGMGCLCEDVAKVGVIADHTFTIYSPKLPMLLPTYGERCGEITLVDIGYSKSGLENITSSHFYINNIDNLIPNRKKFSHKGDFGSLLIIGGGVGMFGASLIAAHGAERVGAGAVTIFTPKEYATSVYSQIPTAMTLLSDDHYFTNPPSNIKKYNVIAVGMGLGREYESEVALADLFMLCSDNNIPLVIDADGLNLIATNYELRELIPKGSLLTPHVGEFRRLVGDWRCENEKIEKLLSFAQEVDSYVILKGAYSVVATPKGELFFNSTGNPALSRAAAGDLLAGVAAGLIAQGLSILDAAKAALYIHGAAADRAAVKFGVRGATITRIIDCIC